VGKDEIRDLFDDLGSPFQCEFDKAWRIGDTGNISDELKEAAFDKVFAAAAENSALFAVVSLLQLFAFGYEDTLHRVQPIDLNNP